METRKTDTEKTLRTIKFDIQTAQKMERIALKLGRPQRLVFVQMVDYFHRSKKDPMDVNDELLKNTLLKQHKDYIGFIRTQESDLLIPIKREVDRMIQNQKKIVDFFNNLDKHNKVMLLAQQEVMDGTKAHSRILSGATLAVTAMSDRLDAKEQMKKKFLYILDSYIRSREAFGMMTPAREREELIQRTKKQIELL
ncbi:BfmA/BtgA family mobilization protein [Sphingobacterium lactis]|uniref:BfmA/BtgA family mobilization protein n=1 Tax=Sphingobacterium lactis TaxID=797291 RepID=UPI003EC5266E